MTLNFQHSSKWLGVYLLIVGLYHVGFYTLTFDRPEVWFYLEPRFYSDMFLFGRIGERSVYGVGIGIGIWLAVLGSLFIAGRRPLMTYLASEVLLVLISLPVLGIYSAIGLAGGGHAVPDIFSQFPLLLVFFVVSLAPLIWTVRIWRRGRTRAGAVPSPST
jgi:hypothetical protein